MGGVARVFKSLLVPDKPDLGKERKKAEEIAAREERAAAAKALEEQRSVMRSRMGLSGMLLTSERNILNKMGLLG